MGVSMTIFSNLKKLGVNSTVLATSIALVACGGGGSDGYYNNDNSSSNGGNNSTGNESTDNSAEVAESLNGIDAVGCGAEYALGSLHILAKQNLTPKEKVLKSLETASFFSAGVSKPFVINGT